MLLAGNEGVALTKLHQELLQVVDNSLLKISFEKALVLWHTEELRYNGILNELEAVLFILGRFLLRLCDNRLFNLRYEQPVIIERTDVALKGSHAPTLLERLLFVPGAHLGTLDSQKRGVIRPCK